MALVLNNLVDLLHVHADLKIDRIHLNARDEFFLSRAFLRDITGCPGERVQGVVVVANSGGSEPQLLSQ